MLIFHYNDLLFQNIRMCWEQCKNPLKRCHIFWKSSPCPSLLTEKYLMPSGSWRRRSNETAQLATLLSRSRRQLCTLGRLALLLRLFSLMQSFKSVLFSSVGIKSNTQAYQQHFLTHLPPLLSNIFFTRLYMTPTYGHNSVNFIKMPFPLLWNQWKK